VDLRGRDREKGMLNWEDKREGKGTGRRGWTGVEQGG